MIGHRQDGLSIGPRLLCAKVRGSRSSQPGIEKLSMSEVIQTAYGINSASFSAPPKQNSGIVATLVATAADDLSGGILVADDQGNIFSQFVLFEFWDMVVGHQSMAIGFYGLSKQRAAPKGVYTVMAKGLPKGRNGGAAVLAILEVSGLRSLDQTGSNGSPGSSNSVATGTSCTAVNSNSKDLVVAALAVPDSVWTNAPRYPPGPGYTGIFTEVISPAGSGIFGAVQAAYKVVDAAETSSADWGSVSMSAGYSWPWVSAVASFSLVDEPNAARQHPMSPAMATLAPLAWIIDRRRRRALPIKG